MTAEQGKPLAESRGEIAYAAVVHRVVRRGRQARLRRRDPGAPAATSASSCCKQPVGVVAAITPWNFPAAMITRKVGAGARRGLHDGRASRPTQTPYSALAMAELAQRAGIPRGVFNVVTGRPSAIGGELTSNPIVRKLTFTGSTEVGKQLMAQCAATVKKVSLELGGNAPFIVFDDADLDAAVAGRDRSQVPQHRPDLRLRQPHPRAGRRLRRVRREARRGRRASSASATGSTGRHRPGAADRRQGRREGRGAHQRCARQGREGRRSAASAMRWAARSSSRRCSPA